jgi:hypothetical protein
MSAILRIVRRKAVRRASRASRTTGSSAITSTSTKKRSTGAPSAPSSRIASAYFSCATAASISGNLVSICCSSAASAGSTSAARRGGVSSPSNSRVMFLTRLKRIASVWKSVDCRAWASASTRLNADSGTRQ